MTTKIEVPRIVGRINPITCGWVKNYKRVVYTKADWIKLRKEGIPFVRYLSRCMIVKGGVTYEVDTEYEPITVEFGGMIHAYIKRKVNYGKGVNQPKKHGKCLVTRFIDGNIVEQKVV